MPIPSPGKIEYGDFSITYKIDEDLQNYLEIFKWMVDLGFPDTFTQYAELAQKKQESGYGLESDISLLVLNAVQKPTYVFTMKDAFPISLIMNPFDTTKPDVTYATATAVFKYQQMDLDFYNAG